MSEKIPLKEIIVAVDLAAKNLWDDLDDEQRKALKKELWILNRYISSAKTNNKEAMSHFVITVNEYFNKNWADLKDHPKLQWMLLCMCSFNGKDTFFHEWIGLNGKKGSKKKSKLLEELYPTLKQDEIELLLEINTDDDIKELASQHGWTDKEIKDL